MNSSIKNEQLVSVLYRLAIILPMLLVLILITVSGLYFLLFG
ncbi:MAG: hypothetical protein OQL19_19340 [Gammaproteobacteria bacterium]|nr:hypothetical protein [Gammaproteobacteria bacterium]